MSREPPASLPRPLSHVIHIGAGTGADLPAWLEAGAGAVLLVEADAEAAARLQARTAEHAGVRVLEAAVSADRRTRPFRRMNFPELNSFRAPAALKELFPGLRILSQEPVKPVDPVQLIAPLGLAEDAANLLVIEAPGEALGILRALDEAGLLILFDGVRVQEGREPLYNRAPTAGDIRAFLTGAGFMAEFETAPDDPDRPYLEARLDRTALARERRIAELEAELAGMRTRLEALTGERDKARRQAGERAARLEALTGERDKARRQAGERAARLEALTGERDKARRQAEERAGELESQRTDLAHAWQKGQDERSDLKVAQKNLSVALRMQMLREADLKDLQTRYAALLRQKEAQDALLNRLTASLSNAAEYLRQLDAPEHKPASGGKKAAIASDD